MSLRGQIVDWDPDRGGNVVTEAAGDYWIDVTCTVLPMGGPWLCRMPRPGLIIDFDPVPPGSASDRTIEVIQRLWPPPLEPVLAEDVVAILGSSDREADLATSPSLNTGRVGELWGKQWTHQASDGVRRGLVGCRAISISMAGSNISDYGARCLAAGLCDAVAKGHLRLTALDLSHCYILERGCVALATALTSTPVARLELWKNQVTDGGARAIARALPSSRLSAIGLRSNYIKADGVEVLSASLPGSSVTYLDLRNNFFGDAGAQALSHHLYDTKVETLLLEGCDIGHHGAKDLLSSRSSAPELMHIAGKRDDLMVHPLHKVRRLDMSCNPLLNLGVTHLADHVHRCSALAHLELRRCSIEDLGYRRLIAGLQGCHSITHLDLSGNMIRMALDAATHSAAVLPNLPLTHLNLADNKIPDSCGKTTLQKRVVRALHMPGPEDPDGEPSLEPVGIEVDEDGCTIKHVTAGGPADRAGIRAGHVLHAIEKCRIASRLLVHPSQVGPPMDLESGGADPRIPDAAAFNVAVRAKSTRTGALALEDLLSRRKMPLGMAPDPAVPLWSAHQWSVRGTRSHGLGQPEFESLPLPTSLVWLNIEGNPCTAELDCLDIQQRIDALLAAKVT